MKVYCDTNIFIDYFDERENYIRPLKDFAFEFFSRGWNCSFELVISDWLIKELRNHLKEEQIQEIFNRFKTKNKLIEINEEPEDRIKSKEFKNPDDALHAILAKKSKANFLATRNIKDYEGCEGFMDIVLPEFI